MARRVTIRLEVDETGAVRGVENVEGEIDELDATTQQSNSSLRRMSKTLKVALTAAAAAAAAAIARSAAKIGAELFQIGVDIQETRNNFETQFGDMSSNMDDFIKDWKDLVSVTDLEAEKMLATIGSILDGVGLTSEKTAELSQRAAKLAADLSSIQNVPLQQALDAITASMLGQNRQLKSLGVAVNQQVTREAALREGIIETDRELNAQERAVASLSAVHERMGSSVGDAARTQNSMRRQSENLERNLRELKEEMAEELLPTMEEIVKILSALAQKHGDEVITAVRGMAEAFKILLRNLENIRQLEMFVALLSKLGKEQTGVDLEQVGIVEPNAAKETAKSTGETAENLEKSSDELTEMRDKRSEMLETLEEIRSGERDRRVILRQQNEWLEKQVENARFLRRLSFGFVIPDRVGRPAEREEFNEDEEPLSEERIRSLELVGQAAEDQFQEVGDIQNRNNQKIAQGISLAADLGATMAEAAQGAEVEWNRVLGQILRSLGSAVALAGNPVAGAGISGAGTLIGSFQHGGTVDTPLQVVGERGPEIAALPQGSRVMSNRESQEVLNQEAVVQEIRSLRGAMRNIQLRVSASETDDSLTTHTAEETRMGAREYTPAT